MPWITLRELLNKAAVFIAFSLYSSFVCNFFVEKVCPRRTSFSPKVSRQTRQRFFLLKWLWFNFQAMWHNSQKHPSLWEGKNGSWTFISRHLPNWKTTKTRTHRRREFCWSVAALLFRGGKKALLALQRKTFIKCIVLRCWNLLFLLLLLSRRIASSLIL